MKQVSSKFIAVLILTVTIVWIGSGFLPVFATNKEPENELRNVESVIPTVGTLKSDAREVLQEVSLYGVTQVYRKVDLRSQTHGTVEKINILEGSQVQKGEIILSLAVEDRKTNLESAKALLEQRQLEYKVSKSLNTSGHQSETKLAEANANLKAAEANLSKAQTSYDDIFIRAPFDGILQELNVELGDFINQSGQKLAVILDDSKILAVAQVPEKKISDIKTDYKAHIKTINGIDTSGIVSYISKISDPITRTFKVEVTADNNNYNFFEGVTAQIIIPTKKVFAHSVKTSYFSLDESGEIGLKTISDKNIVQFNPIKIIKESKSGVWVIGLPQHADIITAGQAYLKEGDVAKVAN